MRVHLDPGICQRHNRCYMLAPEVFDVDEFGQAVQRIDDELPADLEASTRLAAANCPEFAITLTD